MCFLEQWRQCTTAARKDDTTGSLPHAAPSSPIEGAAVCVGPVAAALGPAKFSKPNLNLDFRRPRADTVIIIISARCLRDGRAKGKNRFDSRIDDLSQKTPTVSRVILTLALSYVHTESDTPQL